MASAIIGAHRSVVILIAIGSGVIRGAYTLPVTIGALSGSVYAVVRWKSAQK